MQRMSHGIRAPLLFQVWQRGLKGQCKLPPNRWYIGKLLQAWHRGKLPSILVNLQALLQQDLLLPQIIPLLDLQHFRKALAWQMSSRDTSPAHVKHPRIVSQVLPREPLRLRTPTPGRLHLGGTKMTPTPATKEDRSQKTLTLSTLDSFSRVRILDVGQQSCQGRHLPLLGPFLARAVVLMLGTKKNDNLPFPYIQREVREKVMEIDRTKVLRLLEANIITAR